MLRHKLELKSPSASTRESDFVVTRRRRLAQRRTTPEHDVTRLGSDWNLVAILVLELGGNLTSPVQGAVYGEEQGL